MYHYALLYIAHHKADKKLEVIEDSESEETDEEGFDQSADTPNVDRVIFDIERVVDKACVYTMKGQW